MSSNASIVHCQLWMGGVEQYMTEGFIMTAFQRMGENPLNVKVMRNRISGDLCGYCFVHFDSDEDASKAMHKLNGKFIPNSNPPSRFRLNKATSGGRVPVVDHNQFYLWVGDLSSDVDETQLYKTFATRYMSIRTAKVILDNNGHSKGYGVIRFASEDEQKHCLATMNGYKGLGTKAIKMSSAVPKAHRLSTSTSLMAGGYSSSQDYSQYYDTANYWQSYSAWQTYYENPSTCPTFQISSLPESAATDEDDLELIAKKKSRRAGKYKSRRRGKGHQLKRAELWRLKHALRHALKKKFATVPQELTSPGRLHAMNEERGMPGTPDQDEGGVNPPPMMNSCQMVKEWTQLELATTPRSPQRNLEEELSPLRLSDGEDISLCVTPGRWVDILKALDQARSP